MDNKISAFLMRKQYRVIHSNLKQLNLWVKRTDGITHVVSIVDIRKCDIPANIYSHILEQIRPKYADADDEGEVEFTSFFICDDIKDGADYCKGETTYDKRYVVVRPLSEIVLLDFQEDIKNDFIEELKAYMISNETLSEKLQEETRSSFEIKDYVKPVTCLIIAINMLVYFIQSRGGLMSNADYLYEKGGLFWGSILNDGEYYRFITSMFMHSGMGHLCNNMVMLFFIGGYLESLIGYKKFILCYFTSGIIAGVCSVLYNMNQTEDIVSVGASGAIYGVLGVMMGYFLLKNTPGDNRKFTRLLLFAILSIIVEISSTQVDNAAHIGGVITGFILSLVFLKIIDNDHTVKKSQ